MPNPIIGAVGSVIGGIPQSNAASDAADAQSAAAQQELELQTRIYDETSANFDPFRQGGRLGFDAYLSEIGLGDRPMIGGTPAAIEQFTRPGTAGTPFLGGEGYPGNDTRTIGGRPETTGFRVNGQEFDTRDAAQAFANDNRVGAREFGGFQESPGYQFNLSRGRDALNSSFAARGNLLSGANVAGGIEFNQGLANNEWNNYLNRLQGIGQQGQSAAGNQAAAGQAYATGAGNALAGIGNAQAAGAIGQGNAFTGALNNLSGTFGYLNSQQSAPAPTSGNGILSPGPWRFGAI